MYLPVFLERIQLGAGSTGAGGFEETQVVEGGRDPDTSCGLLSRGWLWFRLGTTG